MSNFEFSLAQIELADASLDSPDGPECILRAALDMCAQDSVSAECVLVDKATDTACVYRLNYVRALMHYMGYSANISDFTVDSLINIANQLGNISLSDAATAALAWNRFENASPKSFDEVLRFLRDTADRPPPGLSDYTCYLVRLGLKAIEERKGALVALDRGKVVIPEDRVRDILSRRGDYSFNALGYHQLDAERLIRHIAWSSIWVGKIGQLRKVGDGNVLEVGTGVIGLRGLPHATVRTIWNHDKQSDKLILLDAIIDGTGI